MEVLLAYLSMVLITNSTAHLSHGLMVLKERWVESIPPKSQNCTS